MTTTTRDTALGRIRGVERAGVERYLGIRFGRVARRFLPCEPAEPWTGELDATDYGPFCPQPDAPNSVLGGVGPGTMAEDCLVLNVFTPAEPAAQSRPVIVWIHGGGFTAGSAYRFDATFLAKQSGCVVVAINYRLGLFGMADLRALGGEYSTSCNVWLSDQIAALAWIQTNIGDYGGDPANVTIMGQSAGGSSVLALASRQETVGLFDKAIALSPGLIVQDDPQQPLVIAAGRGVQAGDVPQLLLDATVDDLVQFTAALSPHPWIDHVVFDRPWPASIAARGDAVVPMITGFCAHEGDCLNVIWRESGFTDPVIEMIAGGVASLTAGGARHVGEYVERLRVVDGVDTADDFSDAVWTDFYRRASTWAAEETAAAGKAAWHYVFDVPSRMGGVDVRSAHCIDLPFTFDWIHDPVPMMGHDWLDRDNPQLRALATNWIAALEAFVRTGDPRGPLGEWPRFDTKGRRSMWVRPTGGSVIDDCASAHREKVWNVGVVAP